MILDAIDEEIIIHVTSLIGQKTHSKRLPRCQLFALVWEPGRAAAVDPVTGGFEGASLGSGGYESVSPRSRRARSRGRVPAVWWVRQLGMGQNYCSQYFNILDKHI